MQTLKALTFSFLLLFLAFPIFAQENAPGLFYEYGYERLQKEAKAQNRPYFLYFFRDGCRGCSQMESEVFTNADLQEYIGNHYFAYRAKAFSIYSDFLVKMYKVESYPQILIFSPEGKEMRRLRGVVSAPQLQRELKAQENAKGTPEALPEVFAEDAQPALSMNLQMFAETKGVYKFSIRKQEVEEKTLAVQLGVFEDYNNIVRTVMELEKHWHDNILVSESTLDGKTIYRLLLGPFYTIEHAESYQRNLREKRGIYGILIHLDTFAPYSWDEREEYSLEQLEGK